MFDEMTAEVETEIKQNRRVPDFRIRSPRAGRSTRFAKKSSGFVGAHRRRNKHWSW